MTPTPLVFCLPGNEECAERLSLAIGGESGQLALRDFPDGETYLRIDSDVTDRDVAVVATLRHPNEKFLPLAFLLNTIRECGARRVGLVAPYLAYMRQDKRFQRGEAVTSNSFAGLISRAADWLITVDPHLHRVSNLREVYSIPAQAVHVAGVVGEWIAGNVSKPLIVGPDDESRQWVERVAAAANAPSIVLRKTRQGDAQVAESAVDLGANASCTPVLVDDIISTGETMAVAIRQLRDQRALPPVCVGIHAVFANGAWAVLKEAGAARVVTTNTIPHASNCIDIVPTLGDALRAQLGG